jgi:hypothetical protein
MRSRHYNNNNRSSGQESACIRADPLRLCLTISDMLLPLVSGLTKFDFY